MKEEALPATNREPRPTNRSSKIARALRLPPSSDKSPSNPDAVSPKTERLSSTREGGGALQILARAFWRWRHPRSKSGRLGRPAKGTYELPRFADRCRARRSDCASGLRYRAGLPRRRWEGTQE